MTNPYARNDDSDRDCIEADHFHLGEVDGQLVMALSHKALPCDLGIFMSRELALEILGRFTSELKTKGWLE